MLLKKLGDVVLYVFNVFAHDFSLVVSDPVCVFPSRLVGIQRNEYVAVFYGQQNMAQDLAMHGKTSNMGSIGNHTENLKIIR